MDKKMVSIGVYVLFYATPCSGTLGIEALRKEKHNKKGSSARDDGRRNHEEGWEGGMSGDGSLTMPTAKPRINALNYVCGEAYFSRPKVPPL